MKKICVFCGKHPVSKTKEHIIPQWLIKMTGDANRKVNLGFDWNKQTMREFSFNQFTFPACSICNSNFKLLEDATKEILISMLNEEGLPGYAFSIFLSWLDKVRVGLWLGYQSLNANPLGIKPNFYIENRIDTADRMVLIYQSKERGKGILFFNVENPFFFIKPSSFCLVVNQYYFLNVSCDFLFSRRLGLPFISNYRWNKEKAIICSPLDALNDGKKHIYRPLFKKYLDKISTAIYQPIINPLLFGHSFYKNDYVKKFFPNSETNIGRVLIEHHDKIDFYEDSGFIWRPESSYDRDTITRTVFSSLRIFQNLFVEEWSNIKMPRERGRVFKKITLMSDDYWEAIDSVLSQNIVRDFKKINKN